MRDKRLDAIAAGFTRCFRAAEIGSAGFDLCGVEVALADEQTKFARSHR